MEMPFTSFLDFCNHKIGEVYPEFRIRLPSSGYFPLSYEELCERGSMMLVSTKRSNANQATLEPVFSLKYMLAMLKTFEDVHSQIVENNIVLHVSSTTFPIFMQAKGYSFKSVNTN